MKKIDLHTHTDISDGSETPEAAVRLAKSLGLAAIAVTDHDTAAGVKRAKAEGEKCERCWKFSTAVGESSAHPTLCPECAAVMAELGL